MIKKSKAKNTWSGGTWKETLMFFADISSEVGFGYDSEAAHKKSKKRKNNSAEIAHKKLHYSSW